MLRETGMWDGHLKAVIALLNLFAATGHTYSLCHACSPLCLGNAPEVCRRLSHCVKESESIGGIEDRHSDQTRRDEVSEKLW